MHNASWIGISIITELEFLAFSGLTAQDEALFQGFKSRIEVVDLKSENEDLIKFIIKIRKEGNLKMPDSIIVASAAHNQATLLTLDKVLLKIDHISILKY